MNLQIDLSQSGLALIFKDYQIEAMKMLWRKSEQGAEDFSLAGYGSREVWKHINKTMTTTTIPVSRDRISRASIINFLNAMVEEGILGYTEITGKGGHRRIYSMKLDEKKFWLKIVAMTLGKLEEASGITLRR